MKKRKQKQKGLPEIVKRWLWEVMQWPGRTKEFEELMRLNTKQKGRDDAQGK